MEGKKEGRKEGRKRRPEDQKEGRKEGRKEGKKTERKGGRKIGRTDDRQKEGKEEEGNWAGLDLLAGRFWPTGHMIDTPDVTLPSVYKSFYIFSTRLKCLEQ